MDKDYLKIEFKGEIYYFSTLHGDKLEGGECIELQPAMNERGYSWAYLNPVDFDGGKIMQFCEEIGTIKNIKIIEDEDDNG